MCYIDRIQAVLFCSGTSDGYLLLQRVGYKGKEFDARELSKINKLEELLWRIILKLLPLLVQDC